jgi:hypothetical protein
MTVERDQTSTVLVGDSADPIDLFVQAVRARARRQAAWRLFGLAFTVGGGALFSLFLVAAWLPSALWRPLALVGALAGASALLVTRARLRRRVGPDAAVARLVRDRLPALGDDLWSAIELGRELPKLDEQPVLSSELVRALRSNVSARLGEINPSRIVDVTPARRQALRRVAVAALPWLLVVVLRPSLLARGWRELTENPDDRLTTSAEPIVGDLRVTLAFPAYTGLGTRVVDGLSGQLLILPGTRVAVEAQALVPTRGSAELAVSEDGRAAEMRPVEVSGQSLKANFTMKRAGSFRFVLGGGLRRVREPQAHRVEIDPDRPPRVDLYTPGDPLEVAGPRRVELAYSIDDDYGLLDVELVWSAGEAAETRKKVLVPKDGQRAASGRFEWDLGELDLQPGAHVAYHLEARDNDDVSGPNVGRSRTFYLSMSSPHEKRERAAGLEEQLLEVAVTQLADRLEVKHDDEAFVELLGPIHNRAEALVVMLAQAEQAAEADKPDGDARKQLAEIHARLSKLVRDEEGMLGEVRKRRPPRGRALDGENAKLVQELERDVIQLDDLLGRQKLEELLRVGDEMTHARDRLKQLLADYKKSRSETVKKEIEREIRELERKLAELKQRAQKLASEMPDQFLNPDAMGKNDLQSRLDKMRDLLAKGDVDAAMAELDKLSSSLDKMMSSMEHDLGDYRRDRFSDEDKRLAELEEKVADLEHDEKQLESETGGIQQRTRAEGQRQMRDKVEPYIKRAREKAAQLKKHLDQVDKATLSVWEQEELQRIKQRAADLDRMLGEGDLDEARNAARTSENGLRALSGDLSDDEARAWRGARPGLKKAREHLDDGEKLARELADEMDQIMPRPDQLMSPEDQKRMPELAERQKAMRKRAAELQRELEQPQKGGSGKPRFSEGIKQAGQHMDRAEGRLRTHNPRDAQGEEQQALDQLGQLKQQLQRERRPRDEQMGERLDKEPVKIPGADEYRAPREFRQDLLEAMKRAAPAEYKDQVKRYYEELVK